MPHDSWLLLLLLLLPLPPAGAVPAAIQDRSSHACLLVLPSDQPSNRKEALAVEELLAQLLQVGVCSVQPSSRLDALDHMQSAPVVFLQLVWM